MPTPVAHSLAAIAVQSIDRRLQVLGTWSMPLLVVLANAPDLDFIPGYLVGSPGAYHWGPTHSVFAAIVVGLLVGILAGRNTGRYAASVGLATAAYGSHIVMDLMVGGPSRMPVGLKLLWPLSNDPVRLEWALFRMAPISISTEGPIATFLSPDILPMIQQELLVMVPVVIISVILARRAAGSRPRRLSPEGGLTQTHRGRTTPE